jgi:hypothetical protein
MKGGGQKAHKFPEGGEDLATTLVLPEKTDSKCEFLAEIGPMGRIRF